MEVLIKKKSVILDSQILSTLMGCERLTEFRFVENLVPVGGRSNSLEVGLIAHRILEVYNKAVIAGSNRIAAIEQGFQAGENLYKSEDITSVPVANEKGEGGKLKFIGYNWIIETMQQYFEKWRADSWIPLEAECVKGEVVYEDDDIRVMWKAKIDVVKDSNQGIFPIDYKTMKQRRDILSLNNQFMGQCILMKTRTMFRETIGWQQTLSPEDKFKREPVNYSADRLMEQLSVTIPYYAKYLVSLTETGYFPPRFTHCDKFFGCTFKGVCEADRGMRREELMRFFKVGEPWDISDDEN